MFNTSISVYQGPTIPPNFYSSESIEELKDVKGNYFMYELTMDANFIFSHYGQTFRISNLPFNAKASDFLKEEKEKISIDFCKE